MILLDTHTLVWLAKGDPSLGEKALKAIDAAQVAGELAVSAITFWELAMLTERGRLDLAVPPLAWRQGLISKGLREIAVDGDVGITAAGLQGFHGDPADRLIAATALVMGGILATADRQILEWKSTLQRLDARR
ncbi:MAG: type II toxin-antitoxin system VapC family toxin [Thermoanaerobaculia bacterium]